MIIIDGHTDIPRDVYLREKKGEENVFKENHYLQLKKSGVNIIFANIFTKCPPRDSMKVAMLHIENLLGTIAKYDDVVLIKNKSDLDFVLKTEKLGIVLSLEGVEPLDSSLALLNIYYQLGLRAGMLTWNSANEFASGADHIEGGLTDLGKLTIEKMNELGIIVDVSHLNEESFWDVLQLNKRPTIASHSNAKALFNHPRNLTDQQMLAIAKNGGVIGAVSYFSKVDKENPDKIRHSDDDTETIDDFIKHIEYMVNLLGYDHVAFGFDFNIYLGDFGVEGLESAENIKDVIALLIDRGHSIEDIRKIAGGNWIRILNTIL